MTSSFLFDPSSGRVRVSTVRYGNSDEFWLSPLVISDSVAVDASGVIEHKHPIDPLKEQKFLTGNDLEFEFITHHGTKIMGRVISMTDEYIVVQHRIQSRTDVMVLRRDDISVLPLPIVPNDVWYKITVPKKTNRMMYDLPMTALPLTFSYSLVLGTADPPAENMLALCAMLCNRAQQMWDVVGAVAYEERRTLIADQAADLQQQYARLRRVQNSQLQQQEQEYADEAPSYAMARAAPMSKRAAAPVPSSSSSSTATGSRLIRINSLAAVLLDLAPTQSRTLQIGVQERLGALPQTMVNRSEGMPSGYTRPEVADRVLALPRERLPVDAVKRLPSAPVHLELLAGDGLPPRVPDAATALFDLWQRHPSLLFLRFGPTQTVQVQRSLLSSQPADGQTLRLVTVTVSNYSDTAVQVRLQERLADRVDTPGRAFDQLRVFSVDAKTVQARTIEQLMRQAQTAADLARDPKGLDWQPTDAFELQPHEPLWLSDDASTDAQQRVDVVLEQVPPALGGSPGMALLVYRFAETNRS